MRKNPHVRICGGLGSATTLVYPTPGGCLALADDRARETPVIGRESEVCQNGGSERAGRGPFRAAVLSPQRHMVRTTAVLTAAGLLLVASTVTRGAARAEAPIVWLGGPAAAPRVQASGGAAAGDDTIVVWPFANITGQADDAWIGTGIAETVTADLADAGYVTVRGVGAVTRTPEGAGFDPEAEAEARRTGRVVGARWVVTGAYQRLGEQLRITARVAEVATGVTVHSAKVDRRLDDLFALQDRLSAELRRGLPGTGAPSAPAVATGPSPAASQPPAASTRAPAVTAPVPSGAPPVVARDAVDAPALSGRVGFAASPGPRIDEPPPPVAPATIARDAAGRATVRAVALEAPLGIDGTLDERVYAVVAPLTGFVQQVPDVGAPATERTEAWVFYDTQHLYVSARLWDSAPESRWVANEMQRNSFQLINNDGFSVGLDTFYDRRNGVSFMVNPIGGFMDMQITDEGNPNLDWNPIWDVATGRFEGGWTAEMKIPFKSIRFQAGTTQLWGFQLSRSVRWKNESSYLTPVPISGGPGMFRLSAAGTLTGVEVPAGNRTFEIKAYRIASMATDLTAVPLIRNAGDGDFGVDVKYGLTQNLTADFTYNTDFAQVEVDEQQVNLTRFSLFFPEKREFFLEGRGIFDFGRGVTFGGISGPGGGGRPGGFGGGSVPTLFFSRRIGLESRQTVPILGGGRLTGKAGDFTIGALNIQTDDARGVGTPGTNFTVLRVKRDILRRSRIGGLFTSRSISTTGDGSSQAYGLDAAFSFFDNVNFNGYYARTETPGSDRDNESYQAAFTYNGDLYAVQADHLRVGDDFNPEVGFLRRDDFRRNFVRAQFSPRPAMRAVRQFIWSGSFDYIEDGAGRLETRIAQAGFQTAFENSDRFTVDVQRRYELVVDPFPVASGVTVPVGGYEFQDYFVSYSMGSQRRLSGSFSVQFGEFSGGAIRAVGYTRGRIELTPQFSFEPGITINRIELPEGNFTTHLGRSFPMLENRAFVVKFTRLFRF